MPSTFSNSLFFVGKMWESFSVLQCKRFSLQCNRFSLCKRFSHICTTKIKAYVFLFWLRLYVPVNNFSVMSGWSHHFLGIISTFLGCKCILLKDTTWQHEWGSNPPTSRAVVQSSTTRPPRLPQHICNNNLISNKTLPNNGVNFIQPAPGLTQDKNWHILCCKIYMKMECHVI